MACPKFDRKNKKHVIIVASVAATVVILIVVIVVVVLSSKSKSNKKKYTLSGPEDLNVGGKDWREMSLNIHNKLRKKHHADPLVLSDELNEKAQKCAEYYANKDFMDHTCPHAHAEGNGENIAQALSRYSDEYNAKKRTQDLYNEIANYDFDRGGFASNTGHFTQLVWKASKKLGLGMARSSSQKVYIVFLYYPPGNMVMEGEFQKNVLPE